VEGESGDLTDSRRILNRRKNYFCQPLNVHGINDVRQRKKHTAEPLVPEPSSFGAEMVMKN
jgi:hypothetical protein